MIGLVPAPPKFLLTNERDFKEALDKASKFFEDLLPVIVLSRCSISLLTVWDALPKNHSLKIELTEDIHAYNLFPTEFSSLTILRLSSFAAYV